MTLTAGHGPLSADPAGWFVPAGSAPAGYAEPHPRRVVAVLAGRTVIDTDDVMLVHRRGHPLSYAFPVEVLGGIPNTPAAEAPGYAYVAWDTVDTWFEEGRELVHYPPNPYHRVDCLPTHRRLRVTVAGIVLVDSTDTVAVFETALAPVLYVGADQVRTDLLHESRTTSYCNYKGWATYWSATVGDTVVDDVAWSYRCPLAESAVLAGCFAFDTTRADVLAELPGLTAGR
ncbi:DUF427 domain-containing protein [Mycobacterium sp. PS03-16]|uniref:DUF427 domain-containing protein n=1 Tax=Mycobacterium sp. PS03-16 TaxID=2559611 RepID=UPI00107425CE|nr:DUF427 domain-containing protein [Mycobacterium sp. PS03-16]TFV56496.1 DUF427 domain-containing protein [Mycobacterium sp. PS03-16]